MAIPVDSRLDVCGVCCPVPLIELAKSVKHLKRGETLEVTGNDPIFESAVRDFCQANGHAVLEVTTGDHHSVSVLLRIGG